MGSNQQKQADQAHGWLLRSIFSHLYVQWSPCANIRTAPGQCVQSPTISIISYITQQNHVWQAGLLRGLSHLHVLKTMHSWIILGLKVKSQKLKLNFLILVSCCTIYSQGTVKRKQTLRHFPVANCSSQNDHGHMTDTCPHCMYTGGQTWKTKQLEVRLACFTDELGSWLSESLCHVALCL